jgi:hypothetical protein
MVVAEVILRVKASVICEHETDGGEVFTAAHREREDIDRSLGPHTLDALAFHAEVEVQYVVVQTH